VRTYRQAVTLARFCANQARIATLKGVAEEMWRLALEYQQEAAKLDSENNLPSIGEKPPKLPNERRRAA